MTVRAAPPCVLIPAPTGGLVFDPRSGDYLAFDEDGFAALLDLHDGRPVAAPAADEARARGWLRFDGRLHARLVDAPPAPTRLPGPLLVHVEVNAVCNLRCAHCFAAPLPRRGPLLEVRELDALFAQMHDLGAMRLSLTGGEPLLRADLLDIVDAANDHELAVALTTNGLLLDEARVDALAARRLQWLNVSLDGARPETNDPVRGAGVFAAVLDKLPLLHGRVPFSLAFTLTTLNLDEIEDCVALADEVGAATAVFRPLYPVGAARDRPDLLPTHDEVARAMDRVRALGGLNGEALDEAGSALVPSGCGAGQTIFSVDAFGRTSPCGFLGEDFLGPSIRDHNLRELWAGPDIERVRAPRDDAFTSGCRARAKSLGGSAFVPDPWAHLR